MRTVIGNILPLAFLFAMQCESGAASRAPLPQAGTEDLVDGSSLAPASEAGTSGSGGNGTIAGLADATFSGLDDASIGSNPDAACAEDTRKAEPTPLDMVIMMDRSRSMLDLVDGGAKWDLLLSALTSFIRDGSSFGLGVGLQYFGLSVGIDDIGDEIASCVVADYANPDVPVGTLPGVADALVASLQAHTPNGGTPTLPALGGALQYARSWAGTHAGHKVFVVLATDGIPNDCESTVPGVANLAAAGFMGAPTVPTYVIGVGDMLTELDLVAAAGGTGKAFIVDTKADVAKNFLQALNTIRNAAALPCRYAIPPVRAGEIRDFDKVNVAYTAGGGQRATVFKAIDPTECDPGSGGWYYDDAANPTAIQLCDATCRAVASDPEAAVEILVGCKSLVVTIR